MSRTVLEGYDTETVEEVSGCGAAPITRFKPTPSDVLFLDLGAMVYPSIIVKMRRSE